MRGLVTGWAGLGRSRSCLPGNRDAAAPKRFLAVGLAAALLASLLTVLMATPALAALGATASTDLHISYLGDSATRTFTVTNSGTPETIGSVAIAEPSTAWNLTACPGTPAGWTVSIQVESGVQYCSYSSAAGPADNLAPGATSSAFQVTATAPTGSANVTGSWRVMVDDGDAIALGYAEATASSAGALAGDAYVFELTDAVVSTGTPGAGTTCPAPSKKAPAGSSRMIVVCGRNHANVARTPVTQAGRSSLAGTFVQTAGTFSSGSIPANSGNVVLTRFANTTITNTPGLNQTVVAQVGSVNADKSQRTTFTGYVSDTTPPVAPSVPDLAAASDSGTSSSDNLTKITTPTFTGTSEAGATVDIIVGGVVKGSAVAAGGNYSVTIPGANALSAGTHSVTATATDPGGNTSPASSALSITVDTSAATPSLPALAPDPRNLADVSWTFGANGETGTTTFDCTLTKPVGAPVAGACTSPQGYDLTGDADGSYTFSVTQTDAAGNVSASASDPFVLDRDAATPAITSRPDDLTNDPAASWGFTGEAGSTFSCTLTGPTGPPESGACTSPASYDLTSKDDGDYTFTVAQTDVAGNVSPTATDSFTLDRNVDVPTITSRPDDPTNDPAASWSFTGEAGATFSCTLTKPDSSTVEDPTCSSPKNYDLTGESDGLYTFEVGQSDSAGNPSLVASDSFVLDRDVDDPSIEASPMAHDDDDTPTWTFAGEAGATFECILVKPDLSEIDDPACTSPKSYDLTSETDGDYTFKVRQTDVAGNTSGFDAHTYQLDRTPPRPVIDDGPAALTNDPMPAFEFHGVSDTTFTCELVRPDLTVITDADCSSDKTYDLTSESDGTYVFRVTQYFLDNASVPETWTFELDRVADQPEISTRPADATATSLVGWTFTGEAGSTFACELSGAAGVVDTAACDAGSYSFDLASEADGPYTFEVIQTDPAGNASAAAVDTFTLDRQAPGAPTFTSAPASAGRVSTITFTFAGEDGATFKCRLTRGALEIQDATDCGTGPSGSKTYALGSMGLPDGTYTVTVYQVDAAENESPAVSKTYRLDRAAPSIGSFRVKPKTFDLRKVKRAKISFTFNEGAKFKLTIKKGRRTVRKLAVKASNTAGSRTVIWDAKDSRRRLVKSGKYLVVLQATDAVGNTVTKKISLTVKR